MTKICCSQCKGTGRANLTPIMQKTLDAIPRDREVTTKFVRESIPTKHPQGETAVNNRLNFLFEHDLIEMTQIGNAKLWKRIK